ncbi:hypothetical protein BpHYR1_016717 [Brachionus plicatilis]|uniref:Uncharacterized protein n=1 Tax=Brachionus plicatilis TaxID=10195 RepID=A0A3M7QLD1_BRAPC|nr:hypothetical protein BpHYR1_016717 [Brachionus plicatilis]
MFDCCKSFEPKKKVQLSSRLKNKQNIAGQRQHEIGVVFGALFLIAIIDYYHHSFIVKVVPFRNALYRISSFIIAASQTTTGFLDHAPKCSTKN